MTCFVSKRPRVHNQLNDYNYDVSYRLQFFLLGQGNSRGNAVKRSHVPGATTHGNLPTAYTLADV